MNPPNQPKPYQTDPDSIVGAHYSARGQGRKAGKSGSRLNEFPSVDVGGTREVATGRRSVHATHISATPNAYVKNNSCYGTTTQKGALGEPCDGLQKDTEIAAGALV